MFEKQDKTQYEKTAGVFKNILSKLYVKEQ